MHAPRIAIMIAWIVFWLCQWAAAVRLKAGACGRRRSAVLA